MKILSILAIIYGFSQCASSRLETNPNFEIVSADYMKWNGGQPGVSGINVTIKLKEKSTIVFDSLYFRKRAAKVEFKDGSVIIANYNTSKNNNRNLTLHKDRRKEVGNKIPKQNNIPFELNDNEAILSYQINEKTKYFKISEIKKRESESYSKIQ